MRALTCKIVTVVTLAVAGLVSVPAMAQVAHADVWPNQFRFAQQAPDHDSGKAPAPKLEVNASPSSDIVLNGGQNQSVPDILGDTPNIARYRFGLQIPF